MMYFDGLIIASLYTPFILIVHEVLRLLDQHERRDTLPDLALLAPVVHVLGGEEPVRKMFKATLEIGCWWP
jgi:hypothetical protein